MKPEIKEVEVGTIILTTGFKPFNPLRAPYYGYVKYPNVYTSLEIERLVNASGPTEGTCKAQGWIRAEKHRYHSLCRLQGRKDQQMVLQGMLHVFAETGAPAERAFRC